MSERFQLRMLAYYAAHPGAEVFNPPSHFLCGVSALWSLCPTLRPGLLPRGPPILFSPSIHRVLSEFVPPSVIHLSMSIV